MELLIVFHIARFGKFLEFYKLEIFGIFEIGIFGHFSNRKFLELSKFEISEIVQIEKFKNL